MTSAIRHRLEQLSDQQRQQLAHNLAPQAVGSGELVGFVSGDESLKEDELHDFMQRNLPAYMVPRRYQLLPKLPRGSNGKIDYQALQGMDLSSVMGAPAPFQDEFERRLAATWRHVLEIEQVGRDDDFFQLGGHSLLAMRLFSAIEREFGSSLPLATIFSRPTIALLAESLRPQTENDANPCIVTLQQGRGLAPLFCMHCGAGNVFHYRELARLLGPDRPVLGLVPAGLDGHGTVHRSVAEMAECYTGWILARFPAGPYLLCGYSFGGAVAYDVARRLRAAGHEVRYTGLMDASVYGTLNLTHSLPGHRRRLAELGALEKMAYLGRSAWGNGRTLLRNRWRAVKRQSQLLPAKALVGMSRPIPVRLQPAYLRDLFGRAMLEYVPQPYDGELTVYRQQAGIWEYRDHPDMGWGEFVDADNLRLVDIPGEHGDMLETPLVESLAASMRTQFSEY